MIEVHKNRSVLTRAELTEARPDCQIEFGNQVMMNPHWYRSRDAVDGQLQKKSKLIHYFFHLDLTTIWNIGITVHFLLMKS